MTIIAGHRKLNPAKLKYIDIHKKTHLKHLPAAKPGSAYIGEFLPLHSNAHTATLPASTFTNKLNGHIIIVFMDLVFIMSYYYCFGSTLLFS